MIINSTTALCSLYSCRALAHGLYPNSATGFPLNLDQGHAAVLDQNGPWAMCI